VTRIDGYQPDRIGDDIRQTSTGAEAKGSVRLAVAGGGTGGHLFPALAVVKALRGKAANLDVIWLTSTRPIDSKILSQNRISYLAQPVRPFSPRPWHWPGFYLAWRRSVALSKQTLEDTGADVVLGTGGYAAGPAMLAARQLGLPAAMLNPDATPGLANRTMSKHATRVFVQWEVTAQHFAPDQAVVVGCPIRQEFLTADKARGCEVFNLDPSRPVLLVNGGSQGSRNINLGMLELIGWMRQTFADWQILHVTGQADFEQVTQSYRTQPGWTAVAFTNDMPLALAAADLVISRAGASTLAEITALGKPSILLPYPYDRKKHQNDNADVLGRAGAAVVVEDKLDGKANAAALKKTLHELMTDQARRQAMAEASRRVGRPDAAEQVADAILKMAETSKRRNAVRKVVAAARRG